jgi:hypothetical protein
MPAFLGGARRLWRSQDAEFGYAPQAGARGVMNTAATGATAVARGVSAGYRGRRTNALLERFLMWLRSWCRIGAV